MYVDLKRTPLYERHVALGGRMVDFGGWELPVQYTGILKEHEKVRTQCGLFDVSHMGEITVQGPGADAFVQHLVTNDVSAIHPGQTLYSPMCYPDGGTVDDLIIYQMAPNDYLLVVNAANTDKDFAWMCEQAGTDVKLENRSADYGQIAIQGPMAQQILQQVCDVNLETIPFFAFQSGGQVAGCKAIVSRTGYTGEDGFEVYVSAEQTGLVWDALLHAGGDAICPVGLGARDTLRFEAKLPLYGQELSADITPLEAALGFFVKLNKEDFIGAQALRAQKAQGLSRKLVEIEMIDRGMPRAHLPIRAAGQEIGHTTSAGVAPTLKKTLALGLVDAAYIQPGTEVEIMVRGKGLKARVVKGGFYKKQTKSK